VKLQGEVFLSELLGKKAMAPDGEKIGKVLDFVVVRGDVFPFIEAFVVKSAGKKRKLPYEAIELFNRRFILVKSEGEDQPLTDLSEKDTLAVKDIMDKQIVDINGAKVVRVNDIKVREVNDRLSLIAVDVGMRGLLRRLGLNKNDWFFWRKLVRRIPYDLISWRYLQPLESGTTHLSLTVSKELMGLHPSDIADILTQIPPENQESLMDTIGIDKTAEVIPEMDEKEQKDLMERMDNEKAADIMEAMSPDDAVDILADLPDEKSEAIIEGMDDEEVQEEFKELLQHEDDTAGGLMTTDYVAVKPEMTVADTLEHLRKIGSEVDNIFQIYVVDDEEHLLGYLPINDLFIKRLEARIGDIMISRIKSLPPDSDDVRAAEMMAKYNMLSLPVIDRENKLLGIITVDDTLEVLLPSLKKRNRYRQKK
jgi:magnesium transporter